MKKFRLTQSMQRLEKFRFRKRGPLPPEEPHQEPAAMTTEPEKQETFEDEARAMMLPLDGPREPEAREHYSMLFLIDYRRAMLQSENAEFFMRCYCYKIRAEQHGASGEYLDEEGYKTRQEWARNYDRKNQAVTCAG